MQAIVVAELMQAIVVAERTVNTVVVESGLVLGANLLSSGIVSFRNLARETLRRPAGKGREKRLVLVRKRGTVKSGRVAPKMIPWRQTKYTALCKAFASASVVYPTFLSSKKKSKKNFCILPWSS